MVRKTPTVRENNRSAGIPSFLSDIVVIVSRGSDGSVKEWLCGRSIRIQEESIPIDFLFIHLKGYTSHSASTADRCLAVCDTSILFLKFRKTALSFPQCAIGSKLSICPKCAIRQRPCFFAKRAIGSKSMT
jgi:hypothetical protein